MLGRDDAAFFAAHYDVTAEGNFEGHNILNRLKRWCRAARTDEARLARAARKAAGGAREARAAGPRRQGAGRLERPDDRGARQRRRARFGEPAWIAMAARAFCSSPRT